MGTEAAKGTVPAITISLCTTQSSSVYNTCILSKLAVTLREAQSPIITMEDTTNDTPKCNLTKANRPYEPLYQSNELKNTASTVVSSQSTHMACLKQIGPQKLVNSVEKQWMS